MANEEKTLPEVYRPEIHEKVWGREEWICNNEKYCGKKLVLKKGYRCSIHHHKVKDETFFVLKGSVLLERGENCEMKDILNEGDSVRLLPNTWHRFTGIKNSEILEFSTKHMEEDSYRKSQSEKIDKKTFGEILDKLK